MPITSIAELKIQLVPGEPKEFVVGQMADLEQQYDMVRPEFVGKPRLCFELAKLIIQIRREINVEENQRQFSELFLSEVNFFCEHLSTRWLVSVCDTIADYGNSQQQKSAICISTFVNLIKLSETERLIGQPAADDVEGFLESWPHSLGGGMTSYHISSGDMPRNLFRRIERCLENTPALKVVFLTILQRIQRSDNLLSRLGRLNRRFWA